MALLEGGGGEGSCLWNGTVRRALPLCNLMAPGPETEQPPPTRAGAGSPGPVLAQQSWQQCLQPHHQPRTLTPSSARGPASPRVPWGCTDLARRVRGRSGAEAPRGAGVGTLP